LVNLAIAAALILLAAAGYWFAYRPLPETSGRVAAPVSKEVLVARDALGVPHISAGALEDALFAQGYATAQERLWQMDGLRRLASGELAEVIGPAALELDREARRFGIRRIAEAALVAIPAADGAALAAYARGVNAFIRTHLDRLPLEFTLLGYQPRPWSAVDSVLVSLFMFRTLTNTWKTDLTKAALLAAGDAAKVRMLFPMRGGGEFQPGSNAWVLAGAHTASGKPLLANDMHLEWSIPGIWFMVHLRAPGLNVSGVALPGVPGVIVGHNERIAWGITNLGFDVQDLYVEQLDERTGRYLFRGKTEQARRERGLIRIKGGSGEEITNWVTVHGPLFVVEDGRPMTLRWVAADPGMFQFPVLDIDRARDWREFTAALSRFPGPGSNFVYADVDGNIGYHVAGKLPVRRNFAGDLPVDGASGEFEWDGYIPFDRLPSSFNPPGGMIVTANQNPFPADYPWTVNGVFAAAYRARQIGDLLVARKQWRAGDMLAVQKDVYSGFHKYLARAVVTAWDKQKGRPPELAEAVAQLRAWNGQMEQGMAAPMLVALTYQYLRRAVGESASPAKGAAWEHEMAPSVVENLLRTRPPGWFSDYDALLLGCLGDAIDEARRIEGRDMRKWDYGRYNRLLIAHPVGHGLPFFGKYFDVGPTPMSGAPTTVKQIRPRVGPSMRMDVDLADWERALLNVDIGQSGHVLSRHYKDEWPRFYAGDSFPMQFGKVDATAVLRLVPQ
jgi:penicillin amidase